MTTDPERSVLAAWKFPLTVAAIVGSIVGAFYLGGAGLALAVGAAAASLVILWAANDRPTSAIVPPVALDGQVRLLLLVEGAVGVAAVDTAAVTVAAAGEMVEVLAVVPRRHGLVERRWISDADKGRRLAEGRLAMVVSAFERAGVRVSGALGDEDPVQAVDDALRSYPATVVAVLATGSTEAADILKARLTVPLVRLRTRGRAARALPPVGGTR